MKKTHFVINALKATRCRLFHKIIELKKRNRDLKMKIKKFQKNKTNLKKRINELKKKLKTTQFVINKIIVIRKLFDLNDY